MDKEEAKKRVIDLIDSADIVENLVISTDTVDVTDTNDAKTVWREFQPTGVRRICITTYKKV